MTNRITNSHIEHMLSLINTRAGFPEGTPLWTRVNDRNVSTIGMYCINGAYGGWQLARISNESGGQSHVTHGYVSKRELYNLMRAFYEGMTATTKGSN